jgi:hypothetical protein
MKHLVTDKTRETHEHKGIKQGLKVQVVPTCSVGQVKDRKLCAYVTRGQNMVWWLGTAGTRWRDEVRKDTQMEHEESGTNTS